jgi:hypothetical protein
VDVLRGSDWWHLNDLCRGDGDDQACEARDRITRRGGPIVIRDLHRAWVARDYAWVRRLVRYSSDVTWYRNVRPASRFEDCSYVDTEPYWYCWVTATNGHDYGTRFEPQDLRPGYLPVWKGGPLAPDV